MTLPGWPNVYKTTLEKGPVEKRNLVFTDIKRSKQFLKILVRSFLKIKTPLEEESKGTDYSVHRHNNVDELSLKLEPRIAMNLHSD